MMKNYSVKLFITSYVQRCHYRKYSDSIKAKVFVSSSKNVFLNLAMEDWFYKNWRFSNQHVLLLWHNEPCVVIGRHQNPWMESNLPYLRCNNIALARRNSGGGTVYHDLGNLNCTFFTDRKLYNRRANLELISQILKNVWDINVTITKREDIVAEDNYKISGTAAKLGSPNAYHHCTLLFDVNKDVLQAALEKKTDDMESNATVSTRCQVLNLKDLNPSIDFWSLVNAISSGYLKHYKCADKWHHINPDEESCPGITKVYSHLSSKEWIFGLTPRFVLKRKYAIPRSMFIEFSVNFNHNTAKTKLIEKVSTLPNIESPMPFFLELALEVYHAKIEKVSLAPELFLPADMSRLLGEILIGKNFYESSLFELLDGALKQYDTWSKEYHSKLRFVSKCLQDMIRKHIG